MKTLALIETPYGYKTPDLLCKAMDAYAVQPDLLAALIECEARLALLVASGRSKMLDAVAAQHARAAIAKSKGE